MVPSLKGANICVASPTRFGCYSSLFWRYWSSVVSAFVEQVSHPKAKHLGTQSFGMRPHSETLSRFCIKSRSPDIIEDKDGVQLFESQRGWEKKA